MRERIVVKKKNKQMVCLNQKISGNVTNKECMGATTTCGAVKSFSPCPCLRQGSKNERGEERKKEKGEEKKTAL